MKKYMRFGNIPTSERSINFLALTFEQNEDLTEDIIVNNEEDPAGYLEWLVEAANEGRRDRKWKKVNLEEAIEKGVSAFEMDDNGNAIADNEQLKKDLEFRIKENSACYIITGEEIGRGKSGEPLLKNIQIIEKIR